MKYGVICVLLFLVQASFAQVLTIKEITGDSVYSFFEIQSSARPEAAKKINAVLQKDWGYDPKAKNPFENMAYSPEASFGYQIATNNDRVLSMNVESQYASCGLHITRFVYNFDSHTGAAVDLNKLFGADGQVKLKKALYKSWKADLKTAAADKDDFHADEYKACLVEAEKTSEQGVDRMLITDHSIKFWAGSCLEGTAYEFEADRSQGPHEYSLGQLLPMLTPYGYSLFVDKSSGPVQSLLRGTIDNKYPISLTLLPGKEGSAAGTIGGMIVYDRVGQPINLNGTMNGNQFVIHELDESNNALSDIELTWDGTKLTGSFINLKTKKQMPFVASMVGGK